MNWTWLIDGTKEKSPDFSELFSGIDGGVQFTTERLAIGTNE